MTSTVVALGHRAIPPSAASRIRSKFSPCFEGVTTGTSIGLSIENTDQRSQDYSAIKDVFCPGDADYTYEQKYGLRDYRGGGRSSPAKPPCAWRQGRLPKYLAEKFGIEIRGRLTQIGDIPLENQRRSLVEQNPFFCPDPTKSTRYMN